MLCISARMTRGLGLCLGLLVLAGGFFPTLAPAQTFTSGSTGDNGPFPPAAVPDGTTAITLDLNTGTVTFLPSGAAVMLPMTPAGGFQDGILHFTTVDLPQGVTLTFVRNALNTPVTMLTQGDVTIAGIINLNGENGGNANNGRGGLGGPGGFRGGNGQTLQSTPAAGAGLGPGGGGGGTNQGDGGGGSYGTPGRDGQGTGAGSGGATYGSATLLPLIGGSGGGGGASGLVEGGSGFPGAGGGGGGGAILLASSTTVAISNSGSIQANGGRGGSFSNNGQEGGSGSGGAIRLIANTITGNGTLSALGGNFAAVGGRGRIRLAAFTDTFTGATNGVTTRAISGVVFPPTALTVRIDSVGGMPVPEPPAGSLGGVDIQLLAPGTFTIALQASNVPLGTTIAVTAKPESDGAVITETSPGLTGTLENSTASVDLVFSSGGVFFLEARATFTTP